MFHSCTSVFYVQTLHELEKRLMTQNMWCSTVYQQDVYNKAILTIKFIALQAIFHHADLCACVVYYF